MATINIGMTQDVEKISAVRRLLDDSEREHPIVWVIPHTLDASPEEVATDLRGLDVLLVANTGVRRPVFTENVFRALRTPILLGVLDYPTDMVSKRVLDGYCANVTAISPLTPSAWVPDALSDLRNGRPLAEYLAELVVDAVRRRLPPSPVSLPACSPASLN